MTQKFLPTIPSNWTWAELGDVLYGIEAGKSFTCAERPPQDSEVGVVKVSAVTWGTFDENASKTCLSPERVDPKLFIQPGDFLFSRANTIQLVGACVIVHALSLRLMLSDKILRLRIHTVVPQWLLYVLRTRWGRSEIERLATGNQESMRNIGQDRVRAIRIPIPPQAEQRRIVAKVEKHLTDIDASRGALATSRKKLDSLISAYIIRTCLFSNPDEICFQPVASIGDVMLGRQRAPKYHTGPDMRPYLRVANVHEDRIELHDINHMNFSDAEFERYGLKEGDLLLNEGQSLELIGRPAMYRGEIPGCCFQNTLVRFRASSEIVPEYALYVFRAWLRGGNFRKVARWTTNIAHLGAERFAAMMFPVRPRASQQTIVDHLEASLSSITHLSNEVKRTSARAVRLRQAILQKAFEGKLVPQNPNDEPVSVLIERIRAASVHPPARRASRKRTREVRT